MECKLDEANGGGDFVEWTPNHPKQDKNCLFGHVARYWRKRTDRNCYIGRKIDQRKEIAQNCSCLRTDFECDFNYERKPGGTCQLVSGLEQESHLHQCTENPNQLEYYDPTGYRRIPLTTCVGGLSLDMDADPKPCPGHEKEFREKHRLSGVGLFFAIVIPILAAASIGYWVWRNWDGKFGRIRLGDDLSSDSPFVRYPVAILSGIVAVIAAIPLLLSSLYRSAASHFPGQRRFTTRASFARRGTYSAVEADEGELLGDESDDEV
jgi:hypothetical protein